MTAPPATKKTASTPVRQAGMSLQSAGHSNPNPIRHGGMGQAERAFSAASTFLSGIMAISASQFIGAPLKLIDPKFYEAYMAWTKESFAVLMTTITQWWAPTVVRVSGDESIQGQLFVMDDGTLKCNFPHRLILMGNHQLYTDWLYLWWIAYTNKTHGRIYIILKESLKKVPIMGWGMQFYNFIFLSRKWEQDRYSFKKHLDHLKDPRDAMWLLIFPEGTNLSAVTRDKSAKWAEKTGVEDMKHQLLPRTTGLRFCLQELRPSTNWLYDCTIAYEGVPQGMYGQDIFTLKSSLFEGRPPKSVNMYWRRFRTSEIPYDDDELFSRWLLNRWREKDYILEYYYKFGNFPMEEPPKAMLAAQGKRKPVHAKAISTSVKGGGWDEFLSIFGPITTAAGALSNVDMTEPLNFDEMIQKALLAANRQNPLPNSVINKLLQMNPQTQSQMKDALKKSGDSQIAHKVSKAPGADKTLPERIQKNMANVGAHVKKVVAKAQQNGPVSSTPAATVRKEVPLASMESMITRPISTMAVHAVGSKAKSLVTQRALSKGSALPGQAAPPILKLPSSITAKQSTTVPRTPVANQSLRNVPRCSSTTPKANLTRSVKSASVKSAPIGSLRKPTQTLVTAAPTNKTLPKNSKPIGTRKYVNGNLV